MPQGFAENTPSRQPQVPQELERLGRVCEELHTWIGSVEEKFSPVLGPDRPPASPGEQNEKIHAARTPLAENLAQLRLRVADGIDRLRRLCERCEV